jgi:IMP dehydrogenase
MVVNPITIGPDETLADALGLMKRPHLRHSGGRARTAGPRASSSASSPIATSASPPIPSQPVAELMTKENLITVARASTRKRPSRLLHQQPHREAAGRRRPYRCVGLITVKDIEKAGQPERRQGRAGRLRVAAATTRRRSRLRARRALIDAGVDLIVVDTAHGHSAPRAASRSRG